ncbi:poly(A) RNA polymerase gld-2 A-like isoform 1, partial [Aphelenchoides avenae]
DVPNLRFTGKLSYSPNGELDLVSFGIRIWLSDHVYRTAFLLRSLARIDKRFSELCLLLKAYFHHVLPQVQKMGHVLTLLAIHYLQSGVSPPVLPILPAIDPMHFGVDSRLQDLTDSVALPAPYAHELNRQTNSELFVGFFVFYKSFDFVRRAVSVSESMRTKTKQSGSSSAAMEVLDPYHQTNVAAHLGQRDFFTFLKTIEDFCSTTFHP